ncbi:hypothetical protein PproGo58_32810 [Pseudomonas protegens]|nr:hypothetical protein PproGo58_32810 [Pseudomonas protegens]
MPAFHLGHGQLHDQLRIARGIILHRPLPGNLRSLIRLLDRHWLHSPALGPGNLRLRLDNARKHQQ